MRVLIIEDSKPLREPVVKALKASGYAVDATGDGKEGFFLAREHAYDVIILDIMLPGMDGWEVLKQLRATAMRPPCCSSRRKRRSRIAWRVCGWVADDYLVKSFAIEELLARVEALGRRKYARRTPKLAVADLELDQAAKTVRAGRS